MKNFKFLDYFKLTVPNQDIIDSFRDSILKPGYQRGLAVKLEASHAGLFNGNGKFYLPGIMERDISTFTTRREKPAKILKHHDSNSDPVGIIVGAEFVSTVPDELKMNKDVQIMMDPTFSAKKQVEAASNFMKDGYPFQDGWRGLGYASLDAILLDEKTIGQVQTGLLDAVSTYFRPGENGVYCTECLSNLMDEGPCEHSIGTVYKDEDGRSAPCTWIPMDHNYKECSLVVFDADPLTSLEVIGETNKDSKKFIFDTKTINEDSINNIEFSFRDFKEDSPMAIPKSLSSVEQKIADVLKEFRPDMKEEDRVKLVKDVAILGKDGLYHPDQKDAELDDESTIKNIVESIETEKDSVDADAIYTDMVKELENKDAQLSKEERDKLPNSVFCGPDRSFPCQDCDHINAARKLVDKYKGPGDKTAIRAKIEHKAKALGCDDSKDSKDSKDASDPVKMVLPTKDQIKTLEDKEVMTLFAFAESEGIDRKIKLARECSKCAEAKDMADSLKEQTDKAIADKEELANQLKYLRMELKDQVQEYATLLDQNLELQSKITGARIDKLSLMGRLSGKFESEDAAKDVLKSVDLDEQEAVFKDSFDIEKASKKLNDGIEHQPDGQTIKDPVLEEDPSKSFMDNLDPTQEAVVNNIKNYYKDGKASQAIALYNKMASMKIIDVEQLPYDKIISAEEDTSAEK